MLKDKIIEPCASAFNSPLLIVPKKSQDNSKKWRLVVDFRKLNQMTVDDIYPLPNITEILDQLGNANYFTTLDLANGYHQVPMHPNDKSKTAFNSPWGTLYWNRMPYGLKGAPATFQRLMNQVLSGLNGIKCFTYLDDVVIYGYDLDDHNKKLIRVLQCFKNYNLKLQPRKCNFLRTEVTYLGHIVTNQGVKPDPTKIEAVQKFPIPRNQTEIKSFLGLTGYYRRFINEYSKLAEPLNKLLRKGIPFNWDAFCDNSFQTLKQKLISPPILIYPNFNEVFIVTTDASDYAIGGILSQKLNHQSIDLPVAFVSRSLNSAERNYPTIEKELLAIVWAVKRFHPYLYGKKFIIKTDHRPLIWLSKNPNPSSRLLRWRIDLDEYDYEIVYKPGKSNQNADALSRIVCPTTSNDILAITRAQTKAQNQSNNSLIDSPNSISPIPTSSTIPANSSSNSPETQKITKLEFESEINSVIEEFHCTPLGGHQGVLRTVRRIKCYYQFPKMMSRVRKFIQKCSSCQKNKAGRRTKIPMRITTTSTEPFEKLFLDIVGPLIPTHEGNKCILTMQDDLTKYSIAVPLKSQETHEVAKAFAENFICKYGIPKSIVTDQGSNFMSQMFKELCKLFRIKKLNTSAYHPQSNGALEKSHLNLAQYLRNYTSNDPLNWDQWIPYAMFTYNSTPHCVTEYMPFELLFGCVPEIPNSLKKYPEPMYNFSDYCSELKNRLQKSWRVAYDNIIKSKQNKNLKSIMIKLVHQQYSM